MGVALAAANPHPPPPPPPTTTTTTTTDALTQTEREAKVTDDVSGLVPPLDEFWTDELNRDYGMTFDPPDNVVTYRGPTNPTCGSDTRALPRNAVYCSVDQHVAYDLDWFQEYLVDYPGARRPS